MLLLCMHKSATSCIDIIEIIISFSMLIATCIGVKGLYNLRKQQKEACYGFYMNFQIYLETLKAFLTGENGSIPSWPQILGMAYKDRIRTENETDYNMAKEVSKFAESFLSFLKSATNQVPPYNKKEEKQKWISSIKELRHALLDMDLCIRIKNVKSQWKGVDFENTYLSLMKAVSYIQESIENFIDKAYK